MNLITLFLFLVISFFVIGLIAAISIQHKRNEACNEREEADDEGLDDRVAIVVSQEVPSVFDTLSGKNSRKK